MAYSAPSASAAAQLPQPVAETNQSRDPNSWLSPTHWQILHSQIRPHTSSVEKFKEVCITGMMGNLYLKKDVTKVLKRLRQMMLEDGRFQQVAKIDEKNYRKEEQAKLVQEWVTLPSNNYSIPNHMSAGARGTVPTLTSSLPSNTNSPFLPNSNTAGSLQQNESSMPERRRLFQQLEAIASNMAAPHAAPLYSRLAQNEARAAVERISRQGLPTVYELLLELSRIYNYDMVLRESHRKDNVNFAAPPAGLMVPPISTCTLPTVASSSANIRTSAEDGYDDSCAMIYGAVRTAMSEWESPLHRIQAILRRMPIQAGPQITSFDIPSHFRQPIQDRSLKIILYAIARNSHEPHRWPDGKDLAVTVNRQQVTTGWKRVWPNRRHELAKAFLPLDVTGFIVKSQPTQTIMLECFKQDFSAAAAICVVRPYAETAIVETFLHGSSACNGVSSNSTYQEKYHKRRDEAMRKLYTKALSNYEHSGSKGESDDDVSTAGDFMSLKCPVSQLRLRVPARGVHCEHLQCFDLASALLTMHKQAFWNCPLCDKPLRFPRDVYVDETVRSALNTASPNVWSLRLALPSERRTSSTWVKDEETKDASHSTYSVAQQENEKHLINNQLSPLPYSWVPHDPTMAALERKNKYGSMGQPAPTAIREGETCDEVLSTQDDNESDYEHPERDADAVLQGSQRPHRAKRLRSPSTTEESGRSARVRSSHPFRSNDLGGISKDCAIEL